MNFFEKRLNSQTVYQGKILKLNVDKVLLCDGTQSFREYVRHSGGAAVLLIQNGKVLLVKQFRYAYGKEIYEIPAGKLEEGENPIIAAARELREETGYKAELEYFLNIYPSPGYTDEIIHVYFAKNPEFEEVKRDEGEFLDFEFIDIEKVYKMIDNGEICDAKTVAAMLKYKTLKK